MSTVVKQEAIRSVRAGLRAQSARSPDIRSTAEAVGLGIYWAWVNRGWTGATKLAGFVAGVGGAALGAWLGFHAATDLLALVTAILGSIAGGNLTLVLLDVVWDYKARDRFVYAEPGGAGGITAEVSVGRSSGR